MTPCRLLKQQDKVTIWLEVFNLFPFLHTTPFEMPCNLIYQHSCIMFCQIMEDNMTFIELLVTRSGSQAFWIHSPPLCNCYDPWHRCFRVICFVYVSVCRDWLFITERDWWILKRVTLKGRRYQHMASSILAFAVMAWRAPDSAPSTDHQRLCGYCLWFIVYSTKILWSVGEVCYLCWSDFCDVFCLGR